MPESRRPGGDRWERAVFLSCGGGGKAEGLFHRELVAALGWPAGKSEPAARSAYRSGVVTFKINSSDCNSGSMPAPVALG